MSNVDRAFLARQEQRLGILRAVKDGASITKALHILTELEERALAEQRAAFVEELDAWYQARKHSREVLDHYDHGFLDALLAAQDIAQPEGDAA